jgi:hypothetical protein
MKNSFNLCLGFNLIRGHLNLKNNYTSKALHFTKDYAKDFLNNKKFT